MSIVVEGLSKSFSRGGTPAVSNVSFEAPSGAITSLVGPSGAGKSTVLRLLAGLEVADAGRIWFSGRDVSSVPVQRRNVGLVFQNYALFGHLSVRENVGFGLEVRGTPRGIRERRVDELLALVQLEGFANRRPSELSGGQRQRVAFARALAIEPEVLLLDEPFGALDTHVRHELRDWLCRFQVKTGVTIILVTHDQSEALEVSKSVVVMRDGRVEQSGPPEDVYDRPTTPFVASFVGGANVLRGRVSRGRAIAGGLEIDAPEGAREGSTIRAFVRPHDLAITKTGDAIIERVVHAGDVIRLGVRLGNGETLAVHQSRSEFETLSLGEGDSVAVSARRARVFVEAT